MTLDASYDRSEVVQMLLTLGTAQQFDASGGAEEGERIVKTCMCQKVRNARRH